MPWSPTRSDEKSIAVSSSRVIAAIPATAPTASAGVGETSNQTGGRDLLAEAANRRDHDRGRDADDQSDEQVVDVRAVVGGGAGFG